MNQYLDATEFKNDDEFLRMARGKVAQLRLILNSQKSALQKDKELQQQAKANQLEVVNQPRRIEIPADNNELRRRALALAAQNRAVTL